jgi:hypothetical protein
MYQFIYQILFLIINPQYFTNIEQKNIFKEEFNHFQKSKNYGKAIESFEKIENISRLIEPELRLDAANAYYILKDTLSARLNYELAVETPDIKLSAHALNQLGNLAILRRDSALALTFFKSAIQKNVNSQEARFNYELIARLYKPKSPPPSSKNQEEQQNQKIEASDKKEDELDEYKSDNISKEKALQLLEDLRYSESKILIPNKNSGKKIEKDW